MGKFDGKVVAITGGARGQGRSHALAFAREGADVAFCDVANQVDTVPYPLSTEADVKETVRQVEALGVRCFATQADVRSTAEVQHFVDDTLTEFGRIDFLLANSGISSLSPIVSMSDGQWDVMIETNLGGVFRAIRAVLPTMLEQDYGRIVATSSMFGKSGAENLTHYAAAKWGVIGLVKSVALEISRSPNITANVVCPTVVNTPMIHNESIYKLFCPDIEHPTLDDVRPLFALQNKMPVPWAEPEDISQVMLFLCSDGARYISGETISVAAGGSAVNSS